MPCTSAVKQASQNHGDRMMTAGIVSWSSVPVIFLLQEMPQYEFSGSWDVCSNGLGRVVDAGKHRIVPM